MTCPDCARKDALIRALLRRAHRAEAVIADASVTLGQADRASVDAAVADACSDEDVTDALYGQHEEEECDGNDRVVH